MNFELPNVDLMRLVPEMFLFLWILVVMTFDLLTKRRTGAAAATLSLAGLAITGAIIATLYYCSGSESWSYFGEGFGVMFVNDPGSMFFKFIFLGAAFMAVAMSYGVTTTKIVHHRGEYFGMIMFSTLGMMFVASSNELISLYIGLELTTIPLFILAAFYKDDKLSVEAGIKYLIVGAFSSALLLYGMSLLYGMTAVPAISEIPGLADALPATTELSKTTWNIANKIVRIPVANDFGYNWDFGMMLFASIITMLAGIGFKLALPPFHQWAPDVYEGSPTPIAAFLSVGSKAAGLIVFAKIFVGCLGSFADVVMQPNDWGILVGVLASLAMIIGNVGAIRQSNIKRMLAYSSIAQAGYIMVGMMAMNELGMASVSFYIFVYMFANMGIFAIATIFEDETGSVQIDSYRGLSKTSPFIAASMSVFLLSLAGIPPLGGFLAKYYVFAAAVKQAGASGGNDWLYYVVGVGLITSVFALYYYANIIRKMYFIQDESPYKLGLSNAGVMVIIIGLIGVFYCGLFPSSVMEFVSQIPSTFGLDTAGL